MNKRKLIEQLARRREALGLTAAQLAERSGLTERSIRNALGSQGNPQLSSLLALVGAQNLFTSGSSYKPIATEAVAALAPDFIITSPLSLPANGGVAAFAAQPGISATPAARAKRIIVVDDLLLLGFGPRIAQALRQLQAGFAEHETSQAR